MFMGLFSFLNSKNVHKEFFFATSDIQKFRSSLENKSFSCIKDIKLTDFGSKLDLVYSRDKQYASIKLFEYVPYTYQEITPVMEYHGEDATALISAIVRGK